MQINKPPTFDIAICDSDEEYAIVPRLTAAEVAGLITVVLSMGYNIDHLPAVPPGKRLEPQDIELYIKVHKAKVIGSALEAPGVKEP